MFWDFYHQSFSKESFWVVICHKMDWSGIHAWGLSTTVSVALDTTSRKLVPNHHGNLQRRPLQQSQRRKILRQLTEVPECQPSYFFFFCCIILYVSQVLISKLTWCHGNDSLASTLEERAFFYPPRKQNYIRKMCNVSFHEQSDN